MKKVFIFLMWFSLLCSPGLANYPMHSFSSAREVPAPRLIAPPGGDVDLRGKPDLRFEWSTEGDVVLRRYYDFRVYQGDVPSAAGLICSDRLKTYEATIPTEVFEDGQVYTWSVRQIYAGGRKSRRNFVSFKVIKK